MRLFIVVEGQSEEAFVKEALKPHLDDRAIYSYPTIVGKAVAERRGHRGRGGGRFKHWQKDIRRLLSRDPSDDLRVTTLFDLYGLPNDFPGLDFHSSNVDTARRCALLENALASVIDDSRFIPYIQRHEFETLVLASLPSLRELLDAKDDLDGVSALEAVVAKTAPEDINDGEITAPSKRLLARVPGFSKSLHGPLAAADTGIAKLREQCPRFDAWVRKLEMLSPTQTQ